MAELQPADGGFLWHAIYGGQCHGQPAGGEEGGCKGEPELGDGEQVFEQGRRRRENTGQGQGSFGFWIYQWLISTKSSPVSLIFFSAHFPLASSVEAQWL